MSAKLKKLRAPIRAGVTKAITEVTAELEKEAPNEDELNFYSRKFDKYLEDLAQADEGVKNEMLNENCSEEDYAAECEASEEYSDKAIRVKLKIEKKLAGTIVIPEKSASVHESVHGEGASSIQYPAIALKKFNGELMEWLSFWSQFEKIHENPKLHDSDKFYYLAQSMVEGSRADELVKSYPQTAANYPKVIAALEERFGKKKLLKQVYIRELLKMVISNARNHEKIPIARMFDKLESHLRSLESLGVAGEQTALFLYPMIESSLPEDVLVAWQRSAFYGKEAPEDEPPKTELDFLIMFLRSEVEAEEQRGLARTGFHDIEPSKKRQEKKNISSEVKKTHEEEVATASGLHVFNQYPCIFCEKNGHQGQDCRKAIKWSLEDKRKIVSEKKVCYCCLKKGHRSRDCKVFVKCNGCGKRHYQTMCQESSRSNEKPKDDKNTENQPVVKGMHSNLCRNGLVLLKTVMCELNTPTCKKKVRILLDDGSQRSYIVDKVAKETNCQVLGNYFEQNSLFGAVLTDVERKTVYRVPLSSINGKNHVNLDLSNKTQISNCIPKIPHGPWFKELKENKIWLNDCGRGVEDIQILIGADLLKDVTSGRIIKLKCGLEAHETIFGWALMGPLPNVESASAMVVSNMLVTDSSITQLWDLDLIGIRDPAEQKSKEEEEKEVLSHFKETVTREPDGRYSVSLPWKGGVQNIPNNYRVAEQRLKSTTEKLRKANEIGRYDKIFKSWLEEGIVCKVEEEINENCHFLPHRAVFKPQSTTTPVRPVFDASCKVGRNPSLNDCLHKGINYIELIPSVMLRFREGRIGVLSDIRKAFQMITVNPEEQKYLRFLWWEDEKCQKIQIYQHQRVVFGLTCSPFLLGAVIDYHLDNVNNLDHVVVKLRNSIYVDNCVTSVDTIEEYEEFKNQSTRIMDEAQMELRQWECGTGEESGVSLLSSSGCGLDSSSIQNSETRVLGMVWDKVEDTLRCEVVPEMIPESFTKRSILSCIQKIFDPMGFLSPVIIVPKMILQETWSKKMDWDEELTGNVRNQFVHWLQGLKKLGDIRVPRNMCGYSNSREMWSIHVFTDASMKAYAAVVFLRVENVDGSVSIQIMQSKARIAPVKKVTIPRLELMSCLIGARLYKSIETSLEIKEVPVTYWTDSTNALAWIQRNDCWGTFVGNRVKGILEVSEASKWRHVPGHMNPADLPSRGCDAEELLRSRWWEGPSWLKLNKEDWPNSDAKADEEVVQSERKKTVVSMKITEIVTPWYAERFSSYYSIVKVIAWMRRFMNNSRKLTKDSGGLSQEEIQGAESQLLLMIQKERFNSSDSVINGIAVLMGEDRLIHVKTKLFNRDDSDGFRVPVLLPNNHIVVERLIREEHLRNGHAGIQVLMAKLREKFWIINGRKEIRKVVNSCVRCRRFKASTVSVPFAPLPENRVKDAKTFEVTGVDLAGPLYLKSGGKAYIVLFTCAVYRAIHLELVKSLSTEDFLLAFFRFVSRRGRPAVVYSDNGTNFVGAENMFKLLDWKMIEKDTGRSRIKWIFNPPSAAWWGGFWERLVQSVKGILRRMLGNNKLNYIQLETCLCEVEAVINARPLTYVTEESTDLIPLTPAMFLQDIQDTVTPEIEALNAEGLRRRHRQLVELKQELRQRFRNEYLGQLIQRQNSKKSRELVAGEVVLVASDNKKRLDFPMARIIELITGRDGKVRVARIKTSTGIFVRPLQRLIPLEVGPDQENLVIKPEVKEIAKVEAQKVEEVKMKELAEEESKMDKEPSSSRELNQVVVTRSGRKVQTPDRLHY